MTESKATKAANLARIRDNQRRSRARRKEYLQELEAKLRSCEQMGVEASAEIQTAARRVLEENKRLRAMLHTRGVPEAEIVAALGSNDKSSDRVSAAPTLMSMLERRWTCNALSDEPHVDTQSDSASVISHSPGIDPTSLPIPSQPALARTANEANSPGSIISSTGTPPSYTSAPFFPMDMTPMPEVKSEAIPQYDYQFDQSPNNSWVFPTGPNYTADSASYYNAASCMDAAIVIRSMRADVGPEIEVDFGCRALGQDCRMSNPTIFNTIEKYSNPAIRM